MTPVIAGKIDPPICPSTNTKAAFLLIYFVALSNGQGTKDHTNCRRSNLGRENSCPYIYTLERKKSNQCQSSDCTKISERLSTVAKKGPEKKPSRLAATASVMMLGTLSEIQSVL